METKFILFDKDGAKVLHKGDIKSGEAPEMLVWEGRAFIATERTVEAEAGYIAVSYREASAATVK